MGNQYRSYLLRLQRNHSQMHWRATLEDAHTGEVVRFATEREMLLYLMQTLTIKYLGLDEETETKFTKTEDEQIDTD